MSLALRMQVSKLLPSKDCQWAMDKAEDIYHTISNIVKRSATENIPTYQIANKMAEERIDAIGKVKLPL